MKEHDLGPDESYFKKLNDLVDAELGKKPAPQLTDEAIRSAVATMRESLQMKQASRRGEQITAVNVSLATISLLRPQLAMSQYLGDDDDDSPVDIRGAPDCQHAIHAYQAACDYLHDFLVMSSQSLHRRDVKQET